MALRWGPTFLTAPGAPPPGALARAFALARAQGCPAPVPSRLRRSALLQAIIRLVYGFALGPHFSYGAWGPTPRRSRSRLRARSGSRLPSARAFAASPLGVATGDYPFSLWLCAGPPPPRTYRRSLIRSRRWLAATVRLVCC